jgi:hypothetical protein
LKKFWIGNKSRGEILQLQERLNKMSRTAKSAKRNADTAIKKSNGFFWLGDWGKLPEDVNTGAGE